MGVVNNEQARNMSFNGRIPMPTEDNPDRTQNIEVMLLPGLNNVNDEQMGMLMNNERFEMFCDTEDMSIVSYDYDADESPDSIDDVDITALNVKKARKFIGSIATHELLDKIEAQERESESRKGVLTGIADHRKTLAEAIERAEGTKD